MNKSNLLLTLINDILDFSKLNAKKLNLKISKKRLKAPSSKRKKGNSPSWRERLNTSKMPEDVKEKIVSTVIPYIENPDDLVYSKFLTPKLTITASK